MVYAWSQLTACLLPVCMTSCHVPYAMLFAILHYFGQPFWSQLIDTYSCQNTLWHRWQVTQDRQTVRVSTVPPFQERMQTISTKRKQQWLELVVSDESIPFWMLAMVDVFHLAKHSCGGRAAWKESIGDPTPHKQWKTDNQCEWKSMIQQEFSQLCNSFPNCRHHISHRRTQDMGV